MRKYIFIFSLAFMIGCDPHRIYEENIDFPDRVWHIDSIPEFEFRIDESTINYDLIFNIRNAIDYPNHNIYFTYFLSSEDEGMLKSELVNFDLFNRKTGKPKGSGLGDIFDHQIILIENYKFDKPGLYKLGYKQYMRTDTLQGILSVGMRLVKSTEDQ
ncbi:MAG: gliding motility lipoprotein GldH [Cyclobacteriaceae bacterium]|nr:gliding motility lipoprotein GldH [Cyclobacteriaceae bacterium]